jgi:hypothetical protein
MAIVSITAPTGAAAGGDCSTLEPARWLIGTWTATSGNERVVEEWRRASDATFEGEGATWSIESGSRKGGESLRLVAMASAVYYLAKVSHNPLPVPFELTSCMAGQLVFENPGHDFPRRLDYTQLAPDRMTVRVSDGAAKAFTLDFRRTP